MFQQVIASSGNYSGFQDMKGRRTVITTEQSAGPTFLFFRPYLASEFPEVTCDKKYFFLYSTDHYSNIGGCYWGKGDYLDCRDFVELGVIVAPGGTLQSETPFLVRFPDEPYPLKLYYHVQYDRGISPNLEQETRMKMTTGGLLHTATWIDADPINVLGEDLPQDHTGYLKIWNVEGQLKGTHYKQQSLVSFITGSVQVSTTVNGQDWVRGIMIDMDSYCDDGRFAFPSYGEYFKKFGQWWCVLTTQAKVGSTLTSPTRGIILCKADETLQLISKVADLNGGNYEVSNWHPCLLSEDPDTLHIYGTDIIDQSVNYSTFDLRQLINYL